MMGLSERTRDSVLALVGALLDGGGSAGRLEFFAVDGTQLAMLHFSFPSVGSISDGELIFAAIAAGVVRTTGKAALARATDSDGDIVFTCDVSDFKGTGTI